MTKAALLFIFALLLATNDVRNILYNGKEVRTTFNTANKFYGVYSGKKKGYLKLNKDGTGEYKYDVFGFAPADCKAEAIAIEWGFIVNESDEIVSFKREYGQSYPVLLKSTSTAKFQGCRREVILDFIMEYSDGSLGVSSSDDWKKKIIESSVH
ncbi:MAG: hypothetical protein AAGG59_09895 [Bacteroidota bacterium]